MADGCGASNSRWYRGHMDERGLLGSARPVESVYIVNYIVTVIILAPGLGALAWAEKLKEKSAGISSEIQIYPFHKLSLWL
jgi:hypothetical protein